jgi:hypothetical protein
MHVPRTIAFFILLVISLPSSAFPADDSCTTGGASQAAAAVTSECAAAVLFTREEGLPCAPQLLASSSLGAAALFPGGFTAGIWGGIVGANASPITEGIGYRGFNGTAAGIEASLPLSPPQGIRIGLFGRITGSLLRHALTNQWFFSPSLRLGLLLPLGTAPGPSSLVLSPFVECFLRSDLPLSIAAGASVRLEYDIGGGRDTGRSAP